jgi:hypothetical protein
MNVTAAVAERRFGVAEADSSVAGKIDTVKFDSAKTPTASFH